MKNENNYTVLQPTSLKELDEILLNNKLKFDFIAGGTDLLVQEKKWKNCKNIIDLSSIKEISESIIIEDDKLIIGAATTYTQIINFPYIKNNYPIIVNSLKQIGSVQIQNRGTLGGNICNASPAGDSLPVLSVLDAELVIGPQKENKYKIIPFNNFFIDYKRFLLNQNEYLTYIKIPIKNKYNYQYFRKVGQRYSMAISKASLALVAQIENNTIYEIKIATGSVNPIVKRLEQVENFLINKRLTTQNIEEACKLINNYISPINDIRSNINYRKYVIKQLLTEALIEASNLHKNSIGN